MNRRLSTILKLIYIILAFGFMVYYLSTNWLRLQAYDWRLNFHYLLISVVLTWVAILGPVVVLRLVFGKLTGHRFSFSEMFKIFNLSFIGRYLPGKMWSVVGIVYFTDRYGIGKRLSLTCVIINEICFKGSGLFWGLAYFIITSNYPELAFAAAAVMLIGLIIVHPGIFQRLFNYTSKLLKKETIELSISYSSILKYFVIYLVFWGIYGLSLYLLVQAVYPINNSAALAVISLLPLAWTVGYLAIIIPGGFGVREGMLVALLSVYMPADIALVIALIQRIISTLIEGINALVALTIKKGRQQKPAH